jgi:hypothetical protein
MGYLSALSWFIVIIFALNYSVHILKTRDLDSYSKMDFYIILFSVVNIILMVILMLISLMYPVYYFLEQIL